MGLGEARRSRRRGQSLGAAVVAVTVLGLAACSSGNSTPSGFQSCADNAYGGSPYRQGPTEPKVCLVGSGPRYLLTVDNFAPNTSIVLTTPDGKELSFTADSKGKVRQVIRTTRGQLPITGVGRSGLPFANSVTAAGAD